MFYGFSELGKNGQSFITKDRDCFMSSKLSTRFILQGISSMNEEFYCAYGGYEN